MQNSKNLNFRRSTIVKKQKLDPIPTKPTPNNYEASQVENNSITQLKEEQRKLQATVQELKQKCREYEQSNKNVSELNKSLEYELKKREKEIHYFVEKIEGLNKDLKIQKEYVTKIKEKKKNYKKKFQELEQSRQRTQDHDPFQQLLEMRALLLQMRLTAHILPLIQQQQRLRQFQTQAIDVDSMTYEQLLQLEEQMGNVSNGIAREDIRRIPKRMIREVDNIQGVCPVCQCNMEVGEKYRKLGCNHYYHAKCIKSWLLQHNNCPVCKQNVVIAI